MLRVEIEDLAHNKPISKLLFRILVKSLERLDYLSCFMSRLFCPLGGWSSATLLQVMHPLLDAS